MNFFPVGAAGHANLGASFASVSTPGTSVTEPGMKTLKLMIQHKNTAKHLVSVAKKRQSFGGPEAELTSFGNLVSRIDLPRTKRHLKNLGLVLVDQRVHSFHHRMVRHGERQMRRRALSTGQNSGKCRLLEDSDASLGKRLPQIKDQQECIDLQDNLKPSKDSREREKGAVQMTSSSPPIPWKSGMLISTTMGLECPVPGRSATARS